MRPLLSLLVLASLATPGARALALPPRALSGPAGGTGAPGAGPAAPPTSPLAAAFREIEARGRALGWNRSLRAASPSVLAAPGAPGGIAAPRDWNVLVLLADFSDHPADRAGHPPAHFAARFFDEDGPSVRSFYLENSYGAFRLQGTVSRWYRLDRTYEYYVNPPFSGLGPYPRNAQRLVEDLLAKASADHDVSRYDNDGDGFVDGLVVVHAGPGAEELTDGDPGSAIFSNQFHLASEIPEDGVTLFDYAITPETGEIGVFAHELGHVLGLLDLYDIDPFDGSAPGLGVWSIMGTGVWLDEGRTPSHFDAWSRARLGFASPAAVPGPLDASFAPVETSPDIRRLSPSGLPSSEYFLLERREKIGFDAFLPGTGLLIYHVDDSVPLNEDQDHLRVAVEQADGAFDLDRPGGSDGDAGDPWPGSAGATALGPGTTPSSRTYGGADTGIRVEGIARTGSDLVASLSVGERAVPRAASYTLTRTSPDEAGPPRPGDTGGLRVVLENTARTAGDLEVHLELSGEALVFAEPPPVLAAGDLEPGASRVAAMPEWVWRVPDPLPRDPAFGRLVVRLSWLDDAVRTERADTFRVGAGESLGDPDPDPGRYAHRSLDPGVADLWQLLEPGAEGGERPFFCGRGTSLTYLPGLDDVLESPEFLLGPSNFLTFDQRIDAENLGSARAYDGGFLEISYDGRDWLPLEPAGGYPFHTEPSTGSRIFERGAFSGEFDDRFLPVSAPLDDAYSGIGDAAGRVARVRFRFGSDGSIQRRGWLVDRIRVDAVPYRVLAPAASAAGGGVLVTIAVDPGAGPYTGSGFTVLRGVGEGPAVELGPAAPATGGEHRFVDPDPPRGVALRYWMRDHEPGGVERLYGPAGVLLPGEPPPSHLTAAFPNPFRPVAGRVLSARATLARPVETIRIYRVDGVLTRSLQVSGEVGSEAVATWDGKDQNGEDLPAGVYLLSVASGGHRSTRKVVLLR